MCAHEDIIRDLVKPIKKSIKKVKQPGDMSTGGRVRISPRLLNFIWLVS